MTTHASSQPVPSTGAPQSLETVIAATGRRHRVQPDLTAVLVRYWRELPRHDAEARRAIFAAIRARVRSGELTERAFAAFVLGDGEEDIVCAATAEYVGRHPVSVEWRQAAIDDALLWIRRGLPLNRGAAFAALLGMNDEAINAALASLRLLLGHAEIETICRQTGAKPSRASRDFLADWLQLLTASETRDPVAEQLLARTLQA